MSSRVRRARRRTCLSRSPTTNTLSASAANAATLTACVKKKCPKGWKKVRWNVQGAAGKQGAAGANGTNGAHGTNGAPGPIINLKDASGAIVGQLLDVVPEGLPIYTVWRDGG